MTKYRWKVQKQGSEHYSIKLLNTAFDVLLRVDGRGDRSSAEHWLKEFETAFMLKLPAYFDWSWEEESQ